MNISNCVYLSPQYDIVGHSGDDFDVKFVQPEKVPANNKERLDILRVRYDAIIFFIYKLPYGIICPRTVGNLSNSKSIFVCKIM
jgi:hypothetical protein